MESENPRVLSILGFGGLLAFAFAVFILMATLFGLHRQSNRLIHFSLPPRLGRPAEHQVGDNSWEVQTGEWIFRSGALTSVSSPAAISMDLESQEQVTFIAFVPVGGAEQPVIQVSLGDRDLNHPLRFEHLANGRLTVHQVDSRSSTPFELAWVQTNLSPLDQHRYTFKIDPGRLSILLDGVEYFELTDLDQTTIEALWLLAEESAVALTSTR